MQVAKVALVGAGRMGALHARSAAANPRLHLAYVADSSADRARPLAERHQAEAAVLEDILQDPTIQGVIVATSTDALLDSTAACLSAGKAVFSEKPLSLSGAALESAEILFDPASPPLFVAFNRRFDPDLAALKRRLDEGEIGSLESLHIVSHDPAAPSLDFVPRSGGLFKDFTVHDFDTAAWMLGEPIKAVYASASCLVDVRIGKLGDVDTAKLILTTRSGRLCTISNSRRSGYGYDQRIEAFGAKGALRVDNRASGAVVRISEEGPRSDPIFGAFPERYANAYAREMDHFADILLLGETPRTGVAEAIAALRLAEAAARSNEFRRPIALD